MDAARQNKGEQMDTKFDEEYIKAWNIPEETAADEGYTDLEVDEIGQVLCSDGDDLIVIRDHNGLWAVRIPADDLQ